MSWLDKLLPPRIQRAPGSAKKIPEGLWVKCPSCDVVLYSADLQTNVNVCPKCTHHLRMSARERINSLLDPEGRFEIGQEVLAVDALKFKDSRKYSERLQEAIDQTGETDAIVADKARQALACGLTPIVCVGETLEERDAGKTDHVVSRQLMAVLSGLGPQLEKIVVAYEPVWAIGTGKTATPEMAQQVHARLRALLVDDDPVAGQSVRLLYGGSMKPDNARDLLAMGDIDGGLIGGASLVAADFAAICRAAAEI